MPAVVVIGGSAGALEPLLRIVAALPADLPAAVLVVIHMPPRARTSLPDILARNGSLPADLARHREPLVAGTVLVAPPDRHLLVHRDHVRVEDGPRVNNHRPAIDPLFRTAARWHGPHSVAVLLSGTLDDGSAGMLTVATRGGTTIVQSPSDALFPDMPANALQLTHVDHALPAEAIGAAITDAVQTPSRSTRNHAMRETPDGHQRTDATPVTPAPLAPAPHTPGRLDVPVASEEAELAGPSTYSCPSCGGVLWETRDAQPSYRCRVGHAFGAGELEASQEDVVEEALWTALRTLEEQASLSERLASRARMAGNASAADRFEERLREVSSRASRIRDVLRRTARAASA